MSEILSFERISEPTYFSVKSSTIQASGVLAKLV